MPYHEYTTAKAALNGFTCNLTVEVGEYGIINTNVVSGDLLKTTDASAVITPEILI